MFYKHVCTWVVKCHRISFFWGDIKPYHFYWEIVYLCANNSTTWLPTSKFNTMRPKKLYESVLYVEMQVLILTYYLLLSDSPHIYVFRFFTSQFFRYQKQLGSRIPVFENQITGHFSHMSSSSSTDSKSYYTFR